MKCMCALRAVGVAMLFLVGCATMNRQPGLEVAVEHFAAPQFQLFESRAVVRIRIDNETPDPVRLSGGVHHLELNGRRVGKALDSAAVEIPAYSSVVRELPITIGNLSIIRSVSESVDSRKASYELNSRLTAEKSGGRRTLSLHREGEVALEELIPATLGQPRPQQTPVFPVTPIVPPAGPAADAAPVAPPAPAAAQ